MPQHSHPTTLLGLTSPPAPPVASQRLPQGLDHRLGGAAEPGGARGHGAEVAWGDAMDGSTREGLEGHR